MTEKYEMTLSLNVLRHLGINLYSSNPAVLSEAVANAWDADANHVYITLDRPNSRIVVQDTGCGMTLEDVNSRYLKIGHERRNLPNGAKTPSGRAVMGRKGIGKLALFSIAQTVLIETIKDGVPNALEMDLKAIETVLRNDDPDAVKKYHPEERSTANIDFAKGTRITLTNLTRGIDQTASHLRRRLARRFSVIGPAHSFDVLIDGSPVTPEDRDFAPTVQYIWTYGNQDQKDEVKLRAVRAEHKEERPSEVTQGVQIHGWLGTAFDSGSLKDPSSGESMNKVPLMIRGKMAQEDVLRAVTEVGVYRNYLVGEIHADYLDDDKTEDIATSSRQSIREDDERYVALLSLVEREMKNIKRQWTDLRNEGGTKAALDIAEIKSWYLSIGKDAKKKAERLFGKINQLGLQAPDRNELFAQGILAFEIMKHRDSLDALDNLAPDDIKSVAKVLSDSSQLEAVMYHRIVQSRLAVIEKFDGLVANKALEKVLQEHLFENLWLLDPGWEPASLPSMEVSMKREFEDIKALLTKEEADSRLDIRYQKTSGMHVIVELKKADVITSTDALQSQVRKYRNALLTWLQSNNRIGEPVAIVCVVGRDLRDWSEYDGRKTSANALRAFDTRVLMYNELLTNARSAYDEYLKKTDDIGRVQKILNAVSRTTTV